MASASWYWTFVRINPSGKYTIREVDSVRAFFQQGFSESLNAADWNSSRDREIQRQVVELLEETTTRESDRLILEQGLRCYISNQILRTCMDIQVKFGNHHGFSLDEILRFVLNDADLRQSILINCHSVQYAPFAAKVLQSFKPNQSSLSTWSDKLTWQENQLNAFLQKRGVFLRSDWSLLNEREPEDLQRILSEYGLSTAEIELSCMVLASYHRVYRSQRRRAGKQGKCPDPTDEQICEMVHLTASVLTPQQLKERLLTIAGYLRKYQIARKTGVSLEESIDIPEINRQTEEQQISRKLSTDGEEFEQQMDCFLDCYRHQFLICLEQAIEQVIEQRLTYLRRKTPDKAEIFVAALNAYFCQKKTMKEVALKVGFKSQSDVTRLLKVKDFRDNVRQHTLICLKATVAELAAAYADPDRLEQLDARLIEEFLQEQIDRVIIKPRANLSPKHSSDSLFIEQLCSTIQRLI